MRLATFLFSFKKFFSKIIFIKCVYKRFKTANNTSNTYNVIMLQHVRNQAVRQTPNGRAKSRDYGQGPPIVLAIGGIN